jgi:hypothetical protein
MPPPVFQNPPPSNTSQAVLGALKSLQMKVPKTSRCNSHAHESVQKRPLSHSREVQLPAARGRDEEADTWQVTQLENERDAFRQGVHDSEQRREQVRIETRAPLLLWAPLLRAAPLTCTPRTARSGLHAPPFRAWPCPLPAARTRADRRPVPLVVVGCALNPEMHAVQEAAHHRDVVRQLQRQLQVRC